MRSFRGAFCDAQRGAIATALSWTLLLATVATAQNRSDGTALRSDLSGVYDVSTLTPRERPPQYGERRALTPEEIEAMIGREASRLEFGARPSDPNRAAPTLGGNVGGYNDSFFSRGTAPVRVGDEYRTSLLTDPPNGRYPPLTERGRARREMMYTHFGGNYGSIMERIVETGDAWWLDREIGPYDDPEVLAIADRCLLSQEATIPVLPKGYNNLKRIVQTDTHVLIYIEWMAEPRVVRLDSEHPPPDVRSLSGDSIGWWEGDTLVVDTTNFEEETWYTSTVFGDPSPAHDQHVVERFRRIDDETLFYQFTVKSSDFQVPYGGEYTWPATSDRHYEFACHEGNYSMGNILRGARQLERDTLAAKSQK